MQPIGLFLRLSTRVGMLNRSDKLPGNGSQVPPNSDLGICNGHQQYQYKDDGDKLDKRKAGNTVATPVGSLIVQGSNFEYPRPPLLPQAHHHSRSR